MSIHQHPQYHHNYHNYHDDNNDDDETLVRLEQPADEPLALQSLLLWLGWSCAEDHHYRDGDDCDVLIMMMMIMTVMIVTVMLVTKMIAIRMMNLHDDIEALRCFGRLNSIDF